MTPENTVIMYDQPALPANPIIDEVTRVEWRGVTASPSYKFCFADGSGRVIYDTKKTTQLLHAIDLYLGDLSKWQAPRYEGNVLVWERVPAPSEVITPNTHPELYEAKLVYTEDKTPYLTLVRKATA